MNSSGPTKLRAITLLAAGVLSACLGARDEDLPGPAGMQPAAGARSTGPAAGGAGGTNVAGSGPGGTAGGTPSAADGPAPMVAPMPPLPTGDCPAGFHRCDNTCASNTSITSCGSACNEPCPTIQDGTATCDGTRCGISCPPDRRPCLNRCLLPGMPCDDLCPADKNLCNGLCVDPTSVTACGPMCTACPMSPSGATTCDGTRCSLKCNEGYYLCESTQACNLYEQPCKKDSQDTCATGYRLCGARCIVETACCTEGKEGCSECQTCSGMPGRCMNKSDGTGCGSDRACRGGVCQQCRTSGTCGDSDPCKTGQYQCSAGVESCRESNKPNGTGCGGQNACLNGSCRQCRNSGECSDNPCLNSSWQCTGGQERCAEMGPRRGGQRVCPDRDDVCIRGRCTECKDGGSCRFEFEPDCRNGELMCFGEEGGEQCVLAGFKPPGTGCPGGTCDAFGFCVRP